MKVIAMRDPVAVIHPVRSGLDVVILLPAADVGMTARELRAVAEFLRHSAARIDAGIAMSESLTAQRSAGQAS